MRVIAVLILAALVVSADAQPETVLEKYRRCKDHFNKALEATKQATDRSVGGHLALWEVFTRCVNGEQPTSTQSDPVDVNALTPEEKERFNKLYEEALRQGNLIEFLKNWSTHEGKVSQGQSDLCQGVDPNPIGSSRSLCKKKQKEQMAQAEAANKTADMFEEYKTCVKNIKAIKVKRENCVNETAGACMAADKQGTAFNANQYLKSCIERPEPTTTPKPPKKGKGVNSCQKQYMRLVSRGKAPADKDKYIATCVQMQSKSTVAVTRPTGTATSNNPHTTSRPIKTSATTVTSTSITA